MNSGRQKFIGFIVFYFPRTILLPKETYILEDLERNALNLGVYVVPSIPLRTSLHDDLTIFSISFAPFFKLWVIRYMFRYAAFAH